MVPHISVILPVYNGAAYLAQAIDSVLGQTFRSDELIIVDDGSTDDTALILRSYLDQQLNQQLSQTTAIRYVYQPNRGVGAARNHGIRLAKTDWLAFLDQDDVWLPEKLALQIACLPSQPQTGIVHSGWQVVDAAGRQLSSVQPWQGLPTLDLNAWVQWKPVFLGAMLFRRDWLLQVGGFNERWQQTGDVDLVLRLAALQCPATWVKQPTVNYRQHLTNTSRNVREQTRELASVLEEFFAQANLPHAVRRLEQESRYQSWVWSAWRFYQFGYGSDMATCLEKSLHYTAKPLTAVVCDWIKQFKLYAADYGTRFDLETLSCSPEWQQIVQAGMSRKKQFRTDSEIFQS